MRVRKVIPTLYSVRGSSWKWVRISELVEILVEYRLVLGPDNKEHEFSHYLDPKEIWDRFFYLSKNIYSLSVACSGRLVEVTKEGEIVGGETLSDEAIQAIEGKFLSHYLLGGNVFFPAGWALSVIKAWEAGIRRIEIVNHEHLDNLDECPEGTLRCVFAGLSFVATVGLDEEGNPIETSRRQAPRHESGCCDQCWASGEIQPGHFQCSFPSIAAAEALKAGEAFRQLYSRGWQVVWEQ